MWYSEPSHIIAAHSAMCPITRKHVFKNKSEQVLTIDYTGVLSNDYSASGHLGFFHNVIVHEQKTNLKEKLKLISCHGKALNFTLFYVRQPRDQKNCLTTDISIL